MFISQFCLLSSDSFIIPAVCQCSVSTQSCHISDTSAIGGVARSQGTHLLVVSGAGQGTQFAVTAPASAPVAATLRLGHHVPVTGGHLAQVGQDFSEAEAFAVIWRVRQRDELTGGRREGSVAQHPDQRGCKITLDVASPGRFLHRHPSLPVDDI